MAYTCRYLVVGGQSKVPGYDQVKCDDTQAVPPIYPKIIGTDGNVYILAFVNCSGSFYNASSAVTGNRMPAQNGKVISAWYVPGGPVEDTAFLIYPYLVGDTVDEDNGRILKNSIDGELFNAGKQFVSFSPDGPDTQIKHNTSTYAWYDTKTMDGCSVTAKVHGEVGHAAEQMALNLHRTGPQGAALAETIGYNISTCLDRIFVAYGIQPDHNVFTIKRGDSCIALAIYKRVITEINSIKAPDPTSHGQLRSVGTNIN